MKRTHDKNCEWILDSIEPWLDGDLERAEAERFERHVAGCADCGAEIEMARALGAELRSLPLRECPDDVVKRAFGELQDAPVTLRERITGWLEPRVDVFLRPAMVAMVLFVAAAGVFVIANRDRLDRGDVSYTSAEVEKAAREARIAFAYIGHYARRPCTVLRDDVMARRVVPSVAGAVAESHRRVVEETLVPEVEEAVLQALFVETITGTKQSERQR